MKTPINKTVLAIVVTLLTVLSSKAQVQPVQWAIQMGGPNGSQQGNSISTDNSGNVYSCGYFPITGTFGTFTLNTSGSFDAFVTKCDPQGNVIWAKNFGGVNPDYGNSVKADGNGNIAIAGIFDGTAVFDTYTLSSTFTNGFVAKLNTNGSVTWVQQFGVTGEAHCFEVTFDPFGNIIVVGMFKGTATFGTITLSNPSFYASFVCKLDASGNVIWAKQFNSTTSYSGCESVSSDGNGNIYTVGSFEGITNFPPYLLTSYGSSDIFICKQDVSGNVIWVKQFGGSNFDYGSSIVSTSSGYLHITGDFQSTASFITSTLTTTSKDAFVAKLDNSGNLVWVTQLGSMNGFMSQATGNSITTDASGNVYSTGLFQGTCSFGTTSLSAAVLTSGGSNPDVYISKLDPNGSFSLVKHLTATGGSSGVGICANTSGQIYTTGLINGAASIESFTMNSGATGPNIFIVKIGADPTIGIDEKESHPEWQIFPNPTRDKITIRCLGEMELKEYSLTDICGKELLSGNLLKLNNESLDISTLEKGVYFLKINTERYILVKKVIKE